MLTKGTKAPDFTAKNQFGKDISLAEYAGKKVALYFYPKDDTPGCTKEACSLRDSHTEMISKGFVVLGVSPDDVASHQKFASKFDLPFSLLADPELAIVKAYGVWGMKKLYGREYEGLMRTTFIIDEKGMISEVIEKVKTDDHAKQILKIFE
ncbi:MAG: thioredoxin-dependent thiol peroxidase [Bacteroidales bacterium]|nr:thioredoxin-dependent thiol peroxidase [Bacteroidales bacterium]